MYPTLFKIGPLTVHSYGLMMAVAVIICALLLSRDASKEGFSKELIYDLMFWSVLAGIVGARIFYILLNLDFFAQNLGEIWKIQQGGLAWQGGLIGGALSATVFIRKKKIPFWKMADLVAPYIALGHAIGRIGCFFNGCCYGRPVEWGIFFPVHQAKLHPTQLYEVVLLFSVFLILELIQRKKLPTGKVFVFYLVLASMERFVVEFFRGDHQTVYWSLSVFQWMSLAIAAVGLYAHTRIKS